MKKIICLVLALTFVLTGCGTTTEKIDNHEVKQAMRSEIISKNDKNTNKDIIVPYSQDDEISNYLTTHLFLDIRKSGYALYPSGKYFNPEYVPTDEGIKIVYLKSEMPKLSVKEAIGLIDGASISECENGQNTVECQVAKAIGSGVEFLNADKTTANAYGYMYDIMVSIDGKPTQIWLKSRPQVDNFFVSMNSNSSLDIMGIGSGDSLSVQGIGPGNSNSFGGVFNGFNSVEDGRTLLNTSEYKKVSESGFLSVKTSPLSTFAADVDTASYTNFRSILNSYIIDDDSYDYKYYYNYGHYSDGLHDVRIEEMLNYFNYDYETSDDIFTVNAEISETPWNKDTQLLVLNVAAKDLPKEEHKGSNLVFLIDTSGSMDERNKLPLVKDSLRVLVNELTENDTVSIVTYSGSESVIIEGASGNEKEEIISAINLLEPYGSTNGEGGIKKAYEIAQKYQDNHSNSRIIMCSDGDLNVGTSSEGELIKLVEDKRKTGVYLSVLGFGTGNYKDNKMEALADNGNGNYYYIDNIKEGYKVLVEDLMATLVTAADDVKFQIEFNPEYIKGYRKIGYENRDMADEDFHDDTKDGGEIGYGDSVTIVYEIVPADSEKKINGSNLKYQTSANSGSNDWLTVSVRYKDHGKKTSNLVEYIVDENNFTEEASDNWKFVSNVVGFGLIINNSEYKEDLTIEQIIDGLDELELVDRDKLELLSLAIIYRNYFS